MNYKGDLEEYIGAQFWLTETHSVEIGLLRGMASRLDTPDGFSPALVAQYGLWFRALKAQAPRDDSAVDELEEELRKAQSV